jgi:hypothetical protein
MTAREIFYEGLAALVLCFQDFPWPDASVLSTDLECEMSDTLSNVEPRRSSVIPNFQELRQSVAEAGKAKMEAARYWINVGIERNGKFLSLPLGIPLDKLKAKPVPSTPGDFHNLRQAEAELWSEIEMLKASLSPGQEVDLDLTVRIRMTAEKEEKETAENLNPYSLGNNFNLRIIKTGG